MLSDLDDTQRYGLALGLIVGLGVAFGAGYMVSGTGATSPTGNAVSPTTVKDKVNSYVSTVTPPTVQTQILNVGPSNVTGLYQVTMEVTAESPTSNQTRTQQTAVYVSNDGEYIFLAEPSDLDNPPQPQMPAQPQQPPAPSGGSQ